MCVTVRAGATASVDCILCQAGTYGTGSGEGLSVRLGFDCDPHVMHAALLPGFRLSVSLLAYFDIF